MLQVSGGYDPAFTLAREQQKRRESVPVGAEETPQGPRGNIPAAAPASQKNAGEEVEDTGRLRWSA